MKEAGLCVSCGVLGKERYSGLHCYGCCITERQRIVRLKYEVMEKYGGRCSCCGESKIAFLSIDHINNDGGKLRKSGEHSGGTRFYKMLKKLPVNRTLRVMCYNCNYGRKSTGICPHVDSSYYEDALSKEKWQMSRGHYWKQPKLKVNT